MAFITRKQQQSMGIVKDSPRHFVTAAPAQPVRQALPPSTAIAVQPIKPAALLDSHNALIGVYREQYKQGARVGEIMPPDTNHNGAHGYSSAAELQARNSRFYFTIGALVMVEAIAAWGMVSTANIAAWIGDVWTIPLWLSLTGIAAFVTIQHVHAGEQRLSPENIELVRAENQFAIEHMDAQTRQLAIRLAARNDLERVKLERDQQQLQLEAGRRAALETHARIAEQEARHTTPQSTMNRLNTYVPAQQGTQQGTQRPQDSPGTRADDAAIWYSQDAVADVPSAILPVEQDAPIVDPVRVAMLNFVADLFLDRDSAGMYRRMDSEGRLAKGVIAPWSKRGGFNAVQREQAREILRQITPALFRYDETAKCWRVNLRDYKRAGDAVDAIDRVYTPAIRGN